MTDPAWLEQEDDRLPAAGDELGAFILEEKLGRGSMGEVWRARGPGGPVAVKIPLRPAFLRHLRKEGLLLGNVDHPNVARFVSADLEHNPPYLVTELVEGQPLRALCTGTLQTNAVTLICDQILAGLQAIHEAEILHLDLKPENVIVPGIDQEKVDHVKIVDLGLGRATTRLMEEVYLSVSLASRVPAVAGTLAYMSPEQRKGKEVDPRADLFAFGILLHELLTGQLPQPGKPLVELRPDLTPRWDVIVNKLTHPDRSRRPQDAKQARYLVSYTLAEKNPVKAPRGGREPRNLFTLDEETFAQASPYEPGQVIGEGYELVALLGRGGFGEVWRATRSEEECALKLILREEARLGLEREVEVARRVQHPGVPAVRADHSGAEVPHVVFDLVRGKSLRLIIHEEEELSISQAMAIFAGMLEIVAACHAEHVVHMDLKPEHFLVDEEGGEPQVSLIDFGLAALSPRGELKGSLHSKVDVRGTLDYMSPEQRKGEVTPAVDVYALGLCLFELLTLHLPKGPQRLRILRRSVPLDVDDLAHKMMSQDPYYRPSLRDARERVREVRDSLNRAGPLARARRSIHQGVLGRFFHKLKRLPARVHCLLLMFLLLVLFAGIPFMPDVMWRLRGGSLTTQQVRALGRVNYAPDSRTITRGLPYRTGKVLIVAAPISGSFMGGEGREPEIDRNWLWLNQNVRAASFQEVATVVTVFQLGSMITISVYDRVGRRLIARYEPASYPEFDLPGYGTTNIIDMVEAMPLR